MSLILYVMSVMFYLAAKLIKKNEKTYFTMRMVSLFSHRWQMDTDFTMRMSIFLAHGWTRIGTDFAMRMCFL